MSENEAAASKYGVQAGALTEAIYVGRLNKGRTMFADKEPQTDMVLAAVAQYVERNFGGAMTATFPRLGHLGLSLEVRVTPLAPDAPTPPPTGPLVEPVAVAEAGGSE